MDLHGLSDGRLDGGVDPGVRRGRVLAGEEHPALLLLEDVLILELEPTTDSTITASVSKNYRSYLKH